MKRSNYKTVSAWRARSVAKYQEGRRGNVVRAQDARGTEEPRDSVVQISDYLQAEQAPEEATRACVSRQTRTVEVSKSSKNFRVARQKRSETPQQRRKREADAEYRRNREQRLVRARGRCEFDVPLLAGISEWTDARCPRVATDGHHLLQRSTHVDHSLENIRVLCHTHHMMIHAEPAWAEEVGWLRREWQQLERHDS